MSDTGQHPVAQLPAQNVLDVLARIETKIDEMRDNHSELTVRVAVLEARFGYVVAALGAVSLLAIGALLKALHLG